MLKSNKPMEILLNKLFPFSKQWSVLYKLTTVNLLSYVFNHSALKWEVYIYILKINDELDPNGPVLFSRL